jgi:hypothetical protein
LSNYHKKLGASLIILFLALSFISMSLVKADNTNLQPMSAFLPGMASKDATYGAGYAVMDSGNLDPNGQPSMRITNTVAGGSDGAAGEVDGTWSMSLSPGEVVYAGCWIKTGPYSGSWISPSATINLDLLMHDPTYGLGIATSSETDPYGNHYQLITTIYPDTQVAPDHNWQFCIYNFTVPSTPVPFITTTVNGTWGVFPTTGSATVDSAILSFWSPVVGMSSYYGSPFFEINPTIIPGPSTSPEPTPTASPTPTPTATPTATPTTPPTYQDSYQNNPPVNMAFFLLICGILAMFALVSLLIDSRLGLVLGMVGVIAVAYIANAGRVFLNTTTDVTTNTVSSNYLSFGGWGILILLIPFCLAMSSFYVALLPYITANGKKGNTN